MSTIPVTCPHCSKIIPLPADKVPPKPVTFPCPGCQGKVPVDGAKLKSAEAAPPAEAEPQQAEAAPAPPPETEAAPAVLDEDSEAKETDGFDLLDHIEVPEGATLPSGLLIAEDKAVGEALREVLAPMKCALKDCISAADARRLTSVNLPPLMIFVGDTIPAPPFEAIEPITTLEFGPRRRTFIILIGKNLKTMDGNAAFFHNVDLVISSSDVNRAGAVIYSAMEFKRSLCGAFIDMLAELEGV